MIGTLKLQKGMTEEDRVKVINHNFDDVQINHNRLEGGSKVSLAQFYSADYEDSGLTSNESFYIQRGSRVELVINAKRKTGSVENSENIFLNLPIPIRPASGKNEYVVAAGTGGCTMLLALRSSGTLELSGGVNGTASAYVFGRFEYYV